MAASRVYPIVLTHGIARFDVFWQDLLLDDQDDPARDLLHYFAGVRSFLRSKGFDVHHSSVPWAESVETRAAQLKRNVLAVLERTGAKKVNLIAHSMGGLDARHMLFADRRDGRIHERVASLTTIGTPHRGTSFADEGIRAHGELIDVVRKLQLDIAGFRDLTCEACARFDEDPEVRRFEDEAFQSIEARAYTGETSFGNVLGVLRLPLAIIQEREGANDGLVPVSSALWERAIDKAVWPETDHFNELAWWDLEQLSEEDPLELRSRIHSRYLDIARQLPRG